jgi:hypothetical protein
MRWGVRYAEDADHGDPVAPTSSTVPVALRMAEAVVELTQELGGESLHCMYGLPSVC